MLDKALLHLKYVLGHWASPAPEIIMTTVKSMPIVHAMVTERNVPSSRDLAILMDSSGGIVDLLDHDRTCSREKGKISVQLQNLLKVSLRVAQAGLKGEGFKSVPWAWVGEYAWTEFEQMVRTGTYAPSHPVIRRIPMFHQDYLLEMARKRPPSKRVQELIGAKKAANEELIEQAAVSGASCTKFLDNMKRALTPGIFTIFCASCGTCEAFELMDHCESTRTPFELFMYRAWLPAEHGSYKKWLDTGVWQDIFG